MLGFEKMRSSQHFFPLKLIEEEKINKQYTCTPVSKGSPSSDFLEMDFKSFGWANTKIILKWWNMKMLDGRYTARSNLCRF